ncbi:MAG: type II toxin-antitoxin system VapC family toxin [Candidatus Bathyarchaeia archaeon]
MLDSNIIAKLVLNEPNSKEARATIENHIKKGYTLHTSDIALPECLNVIWKHANLFADLNQEDIKSTTLYLLKVYDALAVTPTRDIAHQAIEIAQTTKVAAYDAIYIALTQKLNGTLYTADKKLSTTAETITETKLLKPT